MERLQLFEPDQQPAGAAPSNTTVRLSKQARVAGGNTRCRTANTSNVFLEHAVKQVVTGDPKSAAVAVRSLLNKAGVAYVLARGCCCVGVPMCVPIRKAPSAS